MKRLTMTVEEFRGLSKKPEKGRHKKGDAICDGLAEQVRALGVTVTRELIFAKPRRWRFDLSMEPRMLAVEVDGGVWSGGHSRGGAIDAEHDKYNTALCLGWRVLRVTHAMVRDGRALEWVKRALGIT